MPNPLAVEEMEEEPIHLDAGPVYNSTLRDKSRMLEVLQDRVPNVSKYVSVATVPPPSWTRPPDKSVHAATVQRSKKRLPHQPFPSTVYNTAARRKDWSRPSPQAYERQDSDEKVYQYLLFCERKDI